jgi:hypothetical protein
MSFFSEACGCPRCNCEDVTGDGLNHVTLPAHINQADRTIRAGSDVRFDHRRRQSGFKGALKRLSGFGVRFNTRE